MGAFTFQPVHKNDINIGYVIKHGGNIMTVCKKDITRCNFFGVKIFCDSYRLGNKPVLKGIYNDPLGVINDSTN